MAEQVANNPQTTITGAMGSGDSSLTVASASAFPTSGNFRVLIDNELILVGAVSGTTFSSLTRGVESTTAATHSSGATITQVLSVGGLLQLIADRIATVGVKTLATFTASSASNYLSNTVFSAGTWTSLPSMPISFTVTDANAEIVLTVNGAITMATAQSWGVRYQLDGTTNSGVIAGAQSAGTGSNILVGAQNVSLGQLSATTHTVAIQVWPLAAGNLNCRTNTQPNLESFVVTVRQHSVRSA